MSSSREHYSIDGPGASPVSILSQELGSEEAGTTRETAQGTVLGILIALSFSHLLNDTLQSLIPAIYPLLQSSFSLSYAQIGLITLTNQLTASILQPFVGFYTDRFPKPFSLAAGMASTLTGLVLLAKASHFGMVLVSVALVGVGSSVFHPEASRVARMASGGRHGFAQSLFQVGGNAGTSFGPLLAAWIILPHGQGQLLWFTIAALIGIALLTRVGFWYRGNMARLPKKKASTAAAPAFNRRVLGALAILVALVFWK
jgi:FSR family fosmidomycin resistance protein-like MFS transporter